LPAKERADQHEQIGIAQAHGFTLIGPGEQAAKDADDAGACQRSDEGSQEANVPGVGLYLIDKRQHDVTQRGPERPVVQAALIGGLHDGVIDRKRPGPADEAAADDADDGAGDG